MPREPHHRSPGTPLVNYSKAHQTCDRYGSDLISAVAGGHTAVVRLLLEAGADVDEQSDIYGNSLEIASARGDIQIVELLLDFGADIDQLGVRHASALQASSAHGHAEVVQLLLDRSARLSKRRKLHGSSCAAPANSHNPVCEMPRLEDQRVTPQTQNIEYSRRRGRSTGSQTVGSQVPDDHRAGQEGLQIDEEVLNASEDSQRSAPVGTTLSAADISRRLPDDGCLLYSDEAYDYFDRPSGFGLYSETDTDAPLGGHNVRLNHKDSLSFDQNQLNLPLFQDYQPLPLNLDSHPESTRPPSPSTSDIPQLGFEGAQGPDPGVTSQAQYLSGRSSPASFGPWTPEPSGSPGISPSNRGRSPSTGYFSLKSGLQNLPPIRHRSRSPTQRSLTVFKCSYPGCSAPPFQTKYLLKWVHSTLQRLCLSINIGS